VSPSRYLVIHYLDVNPVKDGREDNYTTARKSREYQSAWYNLKSKPIDNESYYYRRKRRINGDTSNVPPLEDV
jgi:hypothetical protein